MTAYVLDYIDVGSSSPHTATSWEVAKDKDFNTILDSSYSDEVNVKKWHSMLPKEDSSGYYKDLEAVYVRFKIHCGEHTSDWFYIEPKSQMKMDIKITKQGEVLKETTATDIKMRA